MFHYNSLIKFLVSLYDISCHAMRFLTFCSVYIKVIITCTFHNHLSPCIIILIIITSRWQYGFPWISLSSSVTIIHLSQQVFQTTSCLHTELMKISSYWLATTGTYMCRGSEKKITYGFFLVSPALFHISCLSNWFVFRLEANGSTAVVLGFVASWICSWYFCGDPIQLFLHAFC